MKKSLLGGILSSLATLLWLIFMLTMPEQYLPDEPGTDSGDLLVGLLVIIGPPILALLGVILTIINAKPTTHKTGRVLLLISLVLSTLLSLIMAVGNTPIRTTWLILSLVALAAGIYGCLLLKKS